MQRVRAGGAGHLDRQDAARRGAAITEQPEVQSGVSALAGVKDDQCEPATGAVWPPPADNNEADMTSEINNDGLKAAIDAINAMTGDDPNKAILAATARGLMIGYDARWSNAHWVSISEEQEFHLPIINPDTGCRSRTFTYAGKTDGIAEFNGKRFVREAKTTSEDIEDPNASYWRRLEIDAQISSYSLAQWQEGNKVEGTLYDVIRKPGIRPKQVTKDAQKDLRNLGIYCGAEIAEESRGLTEENGELYEARLAALCLQEPGKYFARKAVYRTDSQILDYAQELWMIADEIRQAKASSRFYKNAGACMQWNRPCQYLGLCSGHDDINSDKWTRKEKFHTELPLLDGDGRSVLTHSSTSCFKTCHKKYELTYLTGLERADREEEESLYFGSLIHHALEAWWACQHTSTENCNVQCDSSAVNEAAGLSDSAKATVAQ